MRSLIFSISGRAVVPLLLIISLVFWLTGHTEAGGAFAGGLIAAAAFVLRSIMTHPGRAEREEQECRIVIAAGLFTSLLAAITPLFLGNPLLTNVSFGFSLPLGAHADVSMLFELGVFLISAGSAMLILESVIELRTEEDARDPDSVSVEGDQ